MMKDKIKNLYSIEKMCGELKIYMKISEFK